MKKVLIFENNGAFADELSAAFSRIGYEVCGVSDDGTEGAALIDRCMPDVIVLDLVLKNSDGFTVMEHARQTCKAAFIVLGNFTDDAVVSRAIALGARYYLVKPVAASVVADRVAELFDVSQPAELPRPERRRAGSLEERISNIFISVGIPPHIKGYGYLREAVRMAVTEPRVMNNVTKEMYPVIAEKYETSPSKVERAIRHAIEVAWNRGRIDAINAIFGARVFIGSEKPTNSEFIALVADKLILENMI